MGVFRYTARKDGYPYRQIEPILAVGKFCVRRTHFICIIVLFTVSIRVLHPDLLPVEQKGL